mmetsp:Transcript_25118/g.77513  ORF Transcript_25118/g.77513 Transcript_25118/m.77513 type:complete len:182 (-) Transcript_25118:636-1181(-)
MERTCFFCALEPEDHGAAIDLLRERCGQSQRVRVVRLEPNVLRRFSEFQVDDRSDVRAVVCHLFDGRTLLTDTDGLYNALLVAAAKSTGGNVFLALAGVGASGQLASDDIVAQLVAEGQASLSQLHAARRFLTWDDAPSPSQLAHLADYDAAPLLDPPASMRLHAAGTSPQSRPLLRCTLL